MRTSENGIHLIKRFEGLHKKTDEGDVRSYRCPAGRWTIGWGHVKGVRSGMRATEEECTAFLRQDLEVCEEAVERLVKVETNNDIISFNYNNNRVLILECNHMYHKSCWEQWDSFKEFKDYKECPLCRKKSIYIKNLHDNSNYNTFE